MASATLPQAWLKSSAGVAAAWSWRRGRNAATNTLSFYLRWAVVSCVVGASRRKRVKTARSACRVKSNFNLVGGSKGPPAPQEYNLRKNIRVKQAHSPRFVKASEGIYKESPNDIATAIGLVKKSATAKFVESIDLAVRLGIDPRKSDQNVRGITNLPHGTGKVKKVAVLAKGDHIKEAEQAGADMVGAEDLIAKIQGGFKDFDVVLATEEMAPQIGKIGRMLAQRPPTSATAP